MGRAQYCSPAIAAAAMAATAAGGLKRRGPWSPEEDALLSAYVEARGVEDCWRNLPKKAGLLRSGKSCRLRWINYLRPDVKRGGISAEEEDLIIRLHKLIGNRWSLIAGRLPGRTDNEIKNYWKCHLRKRFANGDMDLTTSYKRSKKLDASSSNHALKNCQLRFVSGCLESSAENDAAAVPQTHVSIEDASLSMCEGIAAITQQEESECQLGAYVVEHQVGTPSSSSDKMLASSDAIIQEDIEIAQCLQLLVETPRPMMDVNLSSSNSELSSACYGTDVQNIPSRETPYNCFFPSTSPLTSSSSSSPTSSLVNKNQDLLHTIENPNSLDAQDISDTFVEEIVLHTDSVQLLHSSTSQVDSKKGNDFDFLRDFATDAWQNEGCRSCWDQQAAGFDVQDDFLHFSNMYGGESLLDCI